MPLPTRPFHVWWQRGRGHTSRTLTGRTSSRPCVARRIRSRRRRRHSRRVGTGVHQRVSMLVGKLSLRLGWRLYRDLWHLWTHIHRVRRWLLFSDGWQDWRRPNASTSGRPRAVCVVPCRRVLPDDIDDLSAVLDRRSRCPTALAFRALFRLRALPHQFRFRDRVVLLPRKRLWRRLGQRRQTLHRIRVPMIGSLYIASGIMISHLVALQSQSPALDLPTGTTSELPRYPWTHPPQLPCNTPSQIQRSATPSSPPFPQT